MASGRSLAVLLYGEHLADLHQTGGGAHRLQYREVGRGAGISLAMPPREHPYTKRQVDPFLEGLLPDREETKEALGRKFDVSGRNPFALLEHIGLDCAGAVQFCRPDQVPDVLNQAGELIPREEREIGDRLRELRANDASSWTAAREKWSLAGAQGKFALRVESGAWCSVTGAEPTTHIIKPGVSEFGAQALNEHICLATARRLGLPAATSQYQEFDGQPAIIVDRYDRRRTEDGRVLRVHQEDLCQALSVYPRDKYESTGGPRAVQIIDLLRRASTTRGGLDIHQFLDGLVLNYLLGAPDAHAKNYSVLLIGRTVRLAPLYDIASGFPYDADDQHGLRSAAMKIGGESRFGRVARRHWERFATEIAYPAERLIERVEELARQLPDALSSVLDAEREVAAELRNRLLDPVATNCQKTRQDLR
ncbi:type II toxin-antitoxin system HipA family toxin [Ruania zhangjianzhongii]|uniref:type II toxin-antitoxin system HipA family toxin n=1 Tax=Ruania zhangjianzhongii TaxID=2603206 RepID=UPI0011CC49D5|nr:type II toxin-antitoxin system HipA family toxin [Ruania zhangjianzhongii]